MDLNSVTDDLQSINDGFVYKVVIESTCELFKSKIFELATPDAAEIEIDSDWFATHQECLDDLSSLLSSLSKQLSLIDGKRRVIATKYNPEFDETADDSLGPWDESIALKMFVADAETLKNDSAIDSSISGVVSIDQRFKFSPQTVLTHQ